MAGEEPPNGYVRWRDLTEREERLRRTAAEDFRHFEKGVNERLDKAHLYHTSMAETQNGSIKGLDTRVDAVESVLDQQRGARNLVYALIGTNALLAIATGLLIIGFII
jgi:hypothetical protein